MSVPFQFIVTDTFLLEGRGLIVAPFFPEPQYRFDKSERVRVETPDHRVFEADAEFDIPFVRPKPKVFEYVCLLRETGKSDVPVGSKVSLLNKTAEQVAPPNGGPAMPAGDSRVTEGPPSVS